MDAYTFTASVCVERERDTCFNYNSLKFAVCFCLELRERQFYLVKAGWFCLAGCKAAHIQRSNSQTNVKLSGDSSGGYLISR